MAAGWPEQKEDHISKITRAKNVGGMAQTVEHLPCKHKDLSSNPITAKKKVPTYPRSFLSVLQLFSLLVLKIHDLVHVRSFKEELKWSPKIYK
jgi:hypothetical protein